MAQPSNNSHTAPIIDAAMEAVVELTTLKERLASDTRHTFRTPLTVIDGNARRLANNADAMTSDEVRRRVTTIRETVDKMVDIVEQSIHLSELTSHIQAQPSVMKPFTELVLELVAEHRQFDPRIEFIAWTEGCDALHTKETRLLSVVLDKLFHLGFELAKPNGRLEFVACRQVESLNLFMKAELPSIAPEKSNEIASELFAEKDLAGKPLNKGVELKIIRLMLEQRGATLEASRVDDFAEFNINVPIDFALDGSIDALVLSDDNRS